MLINKINNNILILIFAKKFEHNLIINLHVRHILFNP